MEERLDPARVLPGARSVLCVALNYFQGEPADASWRPVARYAWGRDYHDVVKKKLKALGGWIHRTFETELKVFVELDEQGGVRLRSSGPNETGPPLARCPPSRIWSVRG